MGRFFSIKKIIFIRDELFWLKLFDIFYLFLSFTIWVDLTSSELGRSLSLIRTLLSVFIGFLFYFVSGQYKNINKFITSKSLYLIAIRNFILVLFISNFLIPLKITKIYLPLYIISWIFLTISMTLTRVFSRDLTKSVVKNIRSKENICIYGAGSAGVLLSRAIKEEGIYNVVSFIDESEKLWNREIDGIPISSPEFLKKSNHKIKKVFLAIPSASKSNTKRILDQINNLRIPVMQIPSLNEIISNKKEVSSLRPIELEDLLGRESVNPDLDLLQEVIKDKVIFISGAGGSIGRELTKQIIDLDPTLIIVFDTSEPSIYELTLEINDLNKNKIPIVYVLGNACDEKLVDNIFEKYNIDIVFHAAAYKHVPIVEINSLEGMHNNIISTMVLTKVSKKFKISKFILISSDKAVRPTNIMGLSKRISELIVQNHSFKSKKTCFSMVRFGNVLGSSGSVVPLFKKQISNGGPITLTHPKVIRYFMSISEASQLVIQAAQLAKGGEVFLLDMGDPVFIKDLAIQMVRLSGLTVKDKQNPEGDIEIQTIGLRPGEKLFEELLIDSHSMNTSHPLIYKALERKVDSKFLENILLQMIISLKDKELNKSLELAKKLVPEWKNY